jgi:hypothetical protein
LIRRYFNIATSKHRKNKNTNFSKTQMLENNYDFQKLIRITFTVFLFEKHKTQMKKTGITIPVFVFYIEEN